VCKHFGGVRWGPTGSGLECKGTGHIYPEAKYRARLPQWQKDGIDQAVEFAGPDQMPIVVMTEKGRRREDSFVLLRLSDFDSLRWVVPLEVKQGT